MHKLKKQIYNINLYQHQNSFKLLVYIIDSCNYNCIYCFNEHCTNKILDLNKLYFFIVEVLIRQLNKSHIYLELIGGETTLHPKLVEFCKKIANIKNIYTTIFTNFSKSVDYYKQLIQIDSRIQFILSWHSQNTMYLDKLNYFSQHEITNNIIVADIYEHDNIKQSLYVFDYILEKYPYIKGRNFPLIENTKTYNKTQ